MRALFKEKIDEGVLEKLEEMLYEADLGANYASALTSAVRQHLQNHPKASAEELVAIVRQNILDHLNECQEPETHRAHPHVILIVGVNGNGKTTSVAKLSHLYQQKGKKVVIAAADTFSAAAVEQLETWAHRLNIDIVKGNPKGDPAAVVFDTVNAGKARGVDIILIDTAGRLHTKIPLMQELEKIRRTCKKVIPESPHETLLVLDATTGQNGVDQAAVFQKYVPLSGLILTKLDGTAKGGVAIGIQHKLRIPIKFIGVGEGIDDLQPFNAESFVSALFE